MTRITVDVNDKWLDAAREELSTSTKAATINAALHTFAMRRRAVEIVSAFDSVQMDFGDSYRAWGYGSGRDLSQLATDAREADAGYNRIATITGQPTEWAACKGSR